MAELSWSTCCCCYCGCNITPPARASTYISFYLRPPQMSKVGSVCATGLDEVFFEDVSPNFNKSSCTHRSNLGEVWAGWLRTHSWSPASVHKLVVLDDSSLGHEHNVGHSSVHAACKRLRFVLVNWSFLQPRVKNMTHFWRITVNNSLIL